MKKLALFIGLFTGLAVALLGGLWLLQGVGILRLRPVLCFADCAPVQGPSVAWAVIGALVLSAGGVAVRWCLRRGLRSP